MENVFEKVKGFFKGITELMFAFLTVGILVQVLFGGASIWNGCSWKCSSFN